MNRYPTKPFRGANLEDLSWLIGYWAGTINGDVIDESWSPLLAGSMVGTFRWIRNGAIRIYEFIALVPEGDEIVMHLKHFKADFSGIEEADETTQFVLVMLDGERAVFLERDVEDSSWLHYERFYEDPEQDMLHAWFEKEEGKPRIEGVFRYSRPRQG